MVSKPNKEHPWPHPRVVSWATACGSLPLGGSLCAGPLLKQVGPACQAAICGEGPHTEEGRQRGGLAGGVHPACAVCSCLGIGFPSHLLWASLQELSCQTKPGNYPRLIHTFLVYVLIEV